jgi:hypothetical protein
MCSMQHQIGTCGQTANVTKLASPDVLCIEMFPELVSGIGVADTCGGSGPKTCSTCYVQVGEVLRETLSVT